MLKAWSITTTVRNPERLRDFLVALQPLVGKVWNSENQINYQKLLIKNRLYGYGNQQFYNGLSHDVVRLVNDVDYELDDALVDEIVETKQYKDFDMRSRQSLNPLTKFGFVLVDDGVIRITQLGHTLIASTTDYGDVFLKSFIKWQIPNPASNDFNNTGDYDIVPFVATLKLISEVNRLELAHGGNPVGISKREFCLFVPKLLKHSDITYYANDVMQFRAAQKGKNIQERKDIRDNYRHTFATNFLGTDDRAQVNKLLKNLRDYGDNAIRYFRLTKYIRIRGNGFYIDLEPSRRTEIDALFEAQLYRSKIFADKREYVTYMADENMPKLPWYTKEKLAEIVAEVHSEVTLLQNSFGFPQQQLNDIGSMTEDELSGYIAELRAMRKDLQEKDNHDKSQPVESISSYIEQLENIYKLENRALLLEYLSAMGMHALNDALEIQPNYPVGDDNEPTSTAPGGMADIECYYKDFSMICEVTMLTGRDQWFNEGQPIMRHLRDFENRNTNSYCIFIAPSIHTDSAETFWVANTIGYKGSKQRIAPITLRQFVVVLKTLKKLRETNVKFSHSKLHSLVSSIAASSDATDNSDEWLVNIGDIINAWSGSLLVGE